MPYKDKEKKRKNDKKYYLNNLEKMKEARKQWAKNNPEKVRKINKRWRENNPEKEKERNKRWRENNPEYYVGQSFHSIAGQDRKEYNKEYYKNNQEKIKKYQNQWQKNKCRTDLKYNLNRRIRFLIWNSLKGSKAGRSWESLTGYKLVDLIRQLKKTMPEGFTWKDFLSGELHIDHIIPVVAFNFTRPEHTDFKRCWALNNLRLLSAKENLIKKAKLEKPFQPALKI